MTKRNVFALLLAGEAILCAGLSILLDALPFPAGEAAAFPFSLIGMGLRKLSLGSALGNAAALAIYFLLCLLPAALVLLDWWRKRRALWEDSLLLLLTPALFYGMYQMINPGLLRNASVYIPAVLPVIGGVLHSLWVSWLILRLIRSIFAADQQKLYRFMAMILCALAVIFVYAAFGQELTGLLASVETLREGNVGNEPALGLSYAMLILGWLTDALAYAANTAVIFSGLKLLEAFRTDRYSAECAESARRLARLCARVLAVIILTGAGYNLIQLAFLHRIFTVKVTVSVPVISIAFVLSALLFARICADSKRLKDENDSFI